MTHTVSIVCNACGDEAYRVKERDYTDKLDGCGVTSTCDCNCAGRLGVCGDDDSGMKFFPNQEAT